MIKLKRDEFEFVLANNDCVIIDTKLKGRAIIANRDYMKGEIMTINPIILVERAAMNSILRRYCFCPTNSLGIDPNKVVVMLGIGFLFCHSNDCNLNYIFDFRKRLVTFTTKRAIQRGHELTIDYHTIPWFDVMDDINLIEHMEMQYETTDANSNSESELCSEGFIGRSDT